MKKKKFYFSTEEWQLVLHSLNALKIRLHSEGRYTDTVDDALLAVLRGKHRHVKVAG